MRKGYQIIILYETYSLNRDSETIRQIKKTVLRLMRRNKIDIGTMTRKRENPNAQNKKEETIHEFAILVPLDVLDRAIEALDNYKILEYKMGLEDRIEPLDIEPEPNSEPIQNTDEEKTNKINFISYLIEKFKKKGN